MLRPHDSPHLKVVLALLALLALAFNLPIITAVLLILLLSVLLLSARAPKPLPKPRETALFAAQPPLLDDVARQLASSLSTGQVANVVLTAALRATGAHVAGVALPVEVAHFMTLQLRAGEDRLEIVHRSQSGSSIVEKVIQTGQSQFNRDHSAFAVVLRHEYTVVGALYIERAGHVFTQADSVLLQALAGPAAVSLQNARLLDDQQYQIETLTRVRALSQQLAGVVERETVNRVMLETTRDLLGVQEVALYHCEGSGEEATLTLDICLHRDRFHRDESEKLLTQSTALTSAQTESLQFVRQPVPCIAVPVTHEGSVCEILAVAYTENHTLRHRDLDTLSVLADEVAAHLATVALHEEIRAVSERLRVTINSARDGVLLLGRDGTLFECNPAAERLLGIDKEHFIGKHFVAMLFEMMRTNEGNGLGYSRSQLTELARQLRLEPNHIVRRQFTQNSDGQRIHIEEIGSPVFDAENRIIGRLLVLRDITEQKLLADFRDEITHMAVHDLRGPLTSIINGIDMIVQLGVTEYPEDNERILRLSLESGQSLMRLVDSLLDIAKLESRRMPIKAQPTTARELIATARETLNNSIVRARIDVTTLVPDDLPLLDVDRDLMRRVLINLLDNAIRFTPEGGSVMIAVAHEETGRVAFRISDSGPGISPEDRAVIFEQYRQTANQPLRGSHGTGLGLTFCKLAVEAHGGQISIERATLLSGSCFVVSLPVEMESSAIY